MGKIAVLDAHTIDKIAAGEVVERPASVVKELVENAIDAGASAVTVEIEAGGKKLIRVTDNGSGIEREEIPVAFLSHATSKIRQVEDLETISTLGFRGEALSSIAAVSKVELITRRTSQLTGNRYVIEGGREQAFEEIGAPEGSTFLVRDLFFNTPARSKFLKSDMSEAGEISAMIEQLGLSHPEVSFKFINHGQVKLQTTGKGRLEEVIYSIYGRDVAKALRKVNWENDFLKVGGFVGRPELSRGNRSFENCYINGRYVKSSLLTKAIEDAYKGFLMQHRFPFAALTLTVRGDAVDVNVHPRKLEVRFSRAPEIYDAVYDAVRATLTGQELIPVVEPGGKKRNPDPPPVQALKVAEMSGSYAETLAKAAEPILPAEGSKGALTDAEERLFDGKKWDEEPPAASDAERPKDEPPAVSDEEPRNEKPPVASADHVRGEEAAARSDEKALKDESPVAQEPEVGEQLELFGERLLDPASRSRHRLIGQLFDTYWLVEFDQNFYIIDQHAAHEKVNYERLVEGFRRHDIQSQFLNPPLVVSLTLEEEQRLEANWQLFSDFGFEIEPYGGREYCIRAVPVNLYGFEEADLFKTLLDQLPTGRREDPLDIFASRLATMACKASVKGGSRMSRAEADRLIDELLQLKEPYHCPHGNHHCHDKDRY